VHTHAEFRFTVVTLWRLLVLAARLGLALAAPATASTVSYSLTDCPANFDNTDVRAATTG